MTPYEAARMSPFEAAKIVNNYEAVSGRNQKLIMDFLISIVDQGYYIDSEFVPKNESINLQKLVDDFLGIDMKKVGRAIEIIQKIKDEQAKPKPKK